MIMVQNYDVNVNNFFTNNEMYVLRGNLLVIITLKYRVKEKKRESEFIYVLNFK